MGRVIQPSEWGRIHTVDQREAHHPERSVLQAFVAGAPANTPLEAKCSRRYSAFHTSGRRPLSVIQWVVMHDTEGPTAQSAAAYFEDRNSGGSAHLVVDNAECYRCLDDAEIPWGAPGANYMGFHIEQAGYARWTSLIWSKSHRRLLDRAAYKAALHCRKFGLPARFVDAAGLRQNMPGITTHAECTKAFGGSHTDPGRGWPRLIFMNKVRYWYSRIA